MKGVMNFGGLLFAYDGVLDKNVVTVTVSEVPILGDGPFDRNHVVQVGRCRGGAHQVMGALGLGAAAILDMYPGSLHDPGGHLDDLTPDNDLLLVELGAVAVYLGNGVGVGADGLFY